MCCCHIYGFIAGPSPAIEGWRGDGGRCSEVTGVPPRVRAISGCWARPEGHAIEGGGGGGRTGALPESEVEADVTCGGQRRRSRGRLSTRPSQLRVTFYEAII
jgi:hypothetical protein